MAEEMSEGQAVALFLGIIAVIGGVGFAIGRYAAPNCNENECAQHIQNVKTECAVDYSNLKEKYEELTAENIKEQITETETVGNSQITEPAQPITATIKDIQHRQIPYTDMNGENVKGFVPVTYVIADERGEQYSLFLLNNDAVQKRTATIEFNEVKDNKITVQELIIKYTGKDCMNKYGEAEPYDCKPVKAETLTTQGIVKSIDYNL